MTIQTDFFQATPHKWPRQYAADIYAEPDRDKRAAMLAEVPEQYRDLVEAHVRIWFERRKLTRR